MAEDDAVLLVEGGFLASPFSSIPEFHKINGFQPNNSLNLFHSEELLKNIHVTINTEID